MAAAALRVSAEPWRRRRLGVGLIRRTSARMPCELRLCLINRFSVAISYFPSTLCLILVSESSVRFGVLCIPGSPSMIVCGGSITRNIPWATYFGSRAASRYQTSPKRSVQFKRIPYTYQEFGTSFRLLELLLGTKPLKPKISVHIQFRDIMDISQLNISNKPNF